MSPPKSHDDAATQLLGPVATAPGQEPVTRREESVSQEAAVSRDIRMRQDRVRHLSSEPESSSSARAARPARVAVTTSRASMLDVPVATSTVRTALLEPRSAVDDEPLFDEKSNRRRVAIAAEPGLSLVDRVAVELEELVRDIRGAWRRMESADRITVISAALTMVGVLMPWFSDPLHRFQVGLVSGGIVHAALAIVALVLLSQRNRAMAERRSLRSSRRDVAATARRTSLWHILLGATSTAFGAYFFILFGLQRTSEWPVHIHLGLYWTVIAGMGLSYGGFARFLQKEDHADR